MRHTAGWCRQCRRYQYLSWIAPQLVHHYRLGPRLSWRCRSFCAESGPYVYRKSVTRTVRLDAADRGKFLLAEVLLEHLTYWNHSPSTVEIRLEGSPNISWWTFLVGRRRIKC